MLGNLQISNGTGSDLDAEEDLHCKPQSLHPLHSSSPWMDSSAAGHSAHTRDFGGGGGCQTLRRSLNVDFGVGLSGCSPVASSMPTLGLFSRLALDRGSGGDDSLDSIADERRNTFSATPSLSPCCGNAPSTFSTQKSTTKPAAMLSRRRRKQRRFASLYRSATANKTATTAATSSVTQHPRVSPWASPSRLPVEVCDWVSRRLHRGRWRARAAEEELVALLEKVNRQDHVIEGAVDELTRAHATGDLEQEADSERSLLLAEERKKGLLSRAEWITNGCGCDDEESSFSSVVPAIVTLSDFRVKCISFQGLHSMSEGGSASSHHSSSSSSSLISSYLVLLVKDRASNTVLSTAAELLPCHGPMFPSLRKCYFFSAMQLQNQKPGFELEVELCHLELGGVPKKNSKLSRLLKKLAKGRPFRTRSSNDNHLHQSHSQVTPIGSGTERTIDGSFSASFRELNRFVKMGSFLLNGSSPLQSSCEVEQGTRFEVGYKMAVEPDWRGPAAVQAEGFLTVQISSLCWERRWARLEELLLCFWQFPEQQQKSRPPIDEIDLSQCSTPVIAPPCNVCVRRNCLIIPLQAATPRPPASQRLLLAAADSKAEQEAWIQSLNALRRSAQLWKVAPSTASTET